MVVVVIIAVAVKGEKEREEGAWGEVDRSKIQMLHSVDEVLTTVCI